MAWLTISWTYQLFINKSEEFEIDEKRKKKSVYKKVVKQEGKKYDAIWILVSIKSVGVMNALLILVLWVDLYISLSSMDKKGDLNITTEVLHKG